MNLKIFHKFKGESSENANKFTKIQRKSSFKRFYKSHNSVRTEASCDELTKETSTCFVDFRVRMRKNGTDSPLSKSARRIPQICARGKRAAFTMIELVFVIVITGLVAVAGGKAIVQILQNYTLQKMYAKTEMDSASVIRQISNYLQNSVWDSIAINKTKSIAEVSTSSNGKLSNDNRLYFIEKDLYTLNGEYDNGRMIPYFAGFVDLENSSGHTIKSKITSDDLDKTLGKGSNRVNGISLYFPFINVGTSNIKNKYYQDDIRNNQAIFWIGGADNNNKTLTLGNGNSFITPNQIGDVAMIVNANPSHIRLIDKPGISIDGKTYEKGDLVIARREPSDNTTTYTTIAKKISNIHFWTESSSSLIRIRVCYEAGVAKSIMEEFCKEGIIMQ